MADPTTPPTVDPTIAANLDAQAASATDAATAFNNYNDVIVSSSDSLDHFNTQISVSGINLDDATTSATGAWTAINTLSEKLKTYGTSLTQSNELTRVQTIEMGVATTAILGTRDAFKSLQGVDTSRVNTFSGQWAGLTKAIKESGGGLGELIKAAETGLGKSLPGFAKTSIAAVETFMGTMARSTDNTLRAANAMVQFAGNSGNLGTVLAAAGPHLKNLNELVAQQRESFLSTAGVVNMLPDQLEEYYSKLGGLPEAMTAQVTASDGLIARSGGSTSKTINMLSATILTAVGSGRQYGDVITDLNTAFKNYGLAGENALKFSANMRQISDDNKVSIQSVQTALASTANEFGRFANAGDAAAKVSQGVAEAMNQYAHALQSAGMSGDRALTVSGGLLSNMSKMDVAQRALLSQRTGGPGGLVGAAQIEKLMRDDPKAALDKMRQMIMREAGPAVSVDEAASSPAAAARQARQRALLTQGPFKVAENDQDATRMLDAMSKIGTPGEKDVTKDMSNVLGNTMDKGLDIQGQSLTELQQINIATAKAAAAADATNATLIERTLGGARDEAGNRSKAQVNREAFTADQGFRGAGVADRTKGAYKAGTVTTNTSGEVLHDGLKDFQSAMGKLKGIGEAGIKSLVDNAPKIIAEFTSKLTTAKASGDEDKIAIAKANLDEQTQKIGAARTALNEHKATSTLASALNYTPPSLKPDDTSQPLPPGQQLGVAARGAAGQLSRTAARGASPTGDPTMPGHGASGQLALGAVNVHVTATCDHCGNALNNKTPQAQAVTVANR